MKAIVIRAPGEAALAEVPEPTLGPWEVRVRVRASALNRADLLQIRGLYPAPHGSPKDIPGLEYAGEVEATGELVTRLRPGDKVMGITGGGAFAQLLVVHEREAVRMPEGLAFEDAAAIPEAFLTAWDALVPQGALRSGEWVLIHAVASGVGTAAAQLVGALGARCIGTGRSARKLERVRGELGVDHTVEVSDPPAFAPAVQALTSGRGADLALELVGGSYLPQTLDALAPRGRAILVGLLAGTKAQLELRTVLSRRLMLQGTVLRSRPLEEKLVAALALERHLLPLFANKRLRAVVEEVLPMAELGAALQRMGDNATYGKLVLRW